MGFLIRTDTEVANQIEICKITDDEVGEKLEDCKIIIKNIIRLIKSS